MDYYIGWDVGAWKCTKGLNDSCDALVVMSDDRIVGRYRDNLGASLRKLYDSPAADRPAILINEWFSVCDGEANSKRYSPDEHYCIAIDTPLGWPLHFTNLVNLQVPKKWGYGPDLSNIQNTLLYRYTEREKLKSGLSVIVDSIGSQSTKGMLLLQLLDASNDTWGVWQRENITLVETYPKACLVRPAFVSWMSSLGLTQVLSETFRIQVSGKNEIPKRYGSVNVIAEDVFDAAVCACVSQAFTAGTPTLVSPSSNDPDIWKSEGWIFFPEHSGPTVNQSIADGHKTATCCEDVTTFQQAIQAYEGYVAERALNKKTQA